MYKPVELQISLYDPNSGKVRRSVVYKIAPQRRIEIRVAGRLDDRGKPERRIILLTTDKKGSPESWQSVNVENEENQPC